MSNSRSSDMTSDSTAQLRIISEAMALLSPTAKESEQAKAVADLAVKCVKNCCEKLSISYSNIQLVGSLAKGTWLRGDYDIDIFILFPSEERNNFRALVDELTKCLPSEFSERGLSLRTLRKHSTHPYVYLFNKDISIDVVPAVDVRSIPTETFGVLTPVDRTPLHTEYIIEKIGQQPGLEREIRVFKKFLKSIGSYGSEIKTQGFSGYLTELVVIYSRSAINAIRKFATITPGAIFHLDSPRLTAEEALSKWGKASFYFPDPTDPNRNVASVVSPSTLSNIKLACESFLHFPSSSFFKSPQPLPLSAHRESDLQFLKFIQIETGLLPEDRIWSQLWKNARKTKEYLTRLGFPIIEVRPTEIDPNLFLFVVYSLSETNSPLILEKRIDAYSNQSFKKFIGILKSSSRYGPRINDFELESWIKKPRKKLLDVLKQMVNEGYIRWSRSVDAQIKRIQMIPSFDQLDISILSNISFLHTLEELITGLRPWMRAFRKNMILGSQS